MKNTQLNQIIKEERERIEQEKLKEQERLRKRSEDEEHIAKIKKEIFLAIKDSLRNLYEDESEFVFEDFAEKITDAILKDEIPHISIQY